MNIVDRVKNILLTPRTEWDVIAAEPPNRRQLVLGYVLILAAVPAAIGLLLSLVFTSFFGGMGILWSLVMVVYQLAMAVLMVFVAGFLIDALAPSFGGQKNLDQALKVAAYAYTPAWIGAVVAVVPILGWLVLLAAIGYAVYLLYLGLLQVMKSPQDKAIGYTAVVVVVTLVVGIVIGSIAAVVQGAAMMGAAGIGAGMGGFRSSAPSYERGSAMGKLDDFAKKMEEAGRKMESAEKSGDPNKQAQAAMEALGTAFSGGRKVEPLAVEEVKAFVPDTFAGLPRASQSAERSGVATLMVTTAKATYGGGDKQVRLEVTDAGGAGAMMGLASWMGAMNMEKEDDHAAERTRREGNRLVHERRAKKGGDNEYSVVVADRFVVKAVGTGVDLADLKSGVNGLGLAKLESLKDAGVAKN